MAKTLAQTHYKMEFGAGSQQPARIDKKELHRQLPSCTREWWLFGYEA